MKRAIRLGWLVVVVAVLVVVSGRQQFGQGHGDQAFTDPSGAPPLGLGLGHASNAEVLERIVDRSKGHVPVDPNTLHPPALSPDSNDGFVWHEPKPYTCWVVEPGEHRDYAPGTAVACFVRVTLGDRFVNGDGSLLADAATGKPDDFFGYDCPQGFTVKDFTNNRWIAVRYFDSNLNQIGDDPLGEIRRHQLQLHDREGRRDACPLHRNRHHATRRRNSGQRIREVLGKRLRSRHRLAWPGPREQFRANRLHARPSASILYVAGPHPIDAFYAGDPSGVLPVCNALR